MPTDHEDTAGDTEMSDSAIFLDALNAGLDRVHSRIDEIGTEAASDRTKNAVVAERLANHISLKEVHRPPVEACPKSKANEEVICDHITKHPSIVKKDIGGIVGAAIIGAMLLAGAGYIATQAFGG